MDQASDAKLAISAAEKRRRGEKPTREEATALRRVQKTRDEELRQRCFDAIRKIEWQRWSGRQQKVLNEQAIRYGIPIGGALIVLSDVVRWLHQFFADNARKLAADEEPLDGPALERYRLAKAQREEISLARDLRQTVSRRELRDGHSRLAGILRICGESLLRQFGPAAQKVLNDALDDFSRELDRLFPADDFDALPAA